MLLILRCRCWCRLLRYPRDDMGRRNVLRLRRVVRRYLQLQPLCWWIHYPIRWKHLLGWWLNRWYWWWYLLQLWWDMVRWIRRWWLLLIQSMLRLRWRLRWRGRLFKWSFRFFRLHFRIPSRSPTIGRCLHAPPYRLRHVILESDAEAPRLP